MTPTATRPVRSVAGCAIGSACVALLAVAGCDATSTRADAPKAAAAGPLPTTRLSIADGPTIEVEVAASLSQLRAGMAGRPLPPEDRGVLFAHPDDLYLSLDMRDVAEPLEVVYADETGRVEGVKPLVPNDLREVRSDRPAMYALLLRPGVAAKLGLKASSRFAPPDLSRLPIAPDPLPTVTMTVAGQAFKLEVADEADEMSMGMMYRDAFPEGTGMIFAFREERRLAFYMRNTRVPMDIVYVNADALVVSTHRLRPFEIRSVPSAGPAKYAIELPPGTVEKLQLKVADRLRLPDLRNQTPPDKK